jgi:hypothetical protein
MNIRPIRKTGDSRQGTLKATYDEIVAALGFEPNATDLDDPHKVSASWGFEGPATRAWPARRAFIWCYKANTDDCTSWSFDGDRVLLASLFGADNIT